MAFLARGLLLGLLLASWICLQELAGSFIYPRRLLYPKGPGRKLPSVTIGGLETRNLVVMLSYRVLQSWGGLPSPYVPVGMFHSLLTSTLSCTSLSFTHCENLSPSTWNLKWNQVFVVKAIGNFPWYFQSPSLLLARSLMVQISAFDEWYWNSHGVVSLGSVLLTHRNGPGELSLVSVPIKSSYTSTSSQIAICFWLCFQAIVPFLHYIYRSSPILA